MFARTPGASKQQRLVCAVVFVQDAEPVVEQVVRLKRCERSTLVCNDTGVAFTNETAATRALRTERTCETIVPVTKREGRVTSLGREGRSK